MGYSRSQKASQRYVSAILGNAIRKVISAKRCEHGYTSVAVTLGLARLSSPFTDEIETFAIPNRG